ncbi:MAG: GNAT family N-acetyltransferase [Candidatus Sabulitectum sp.]|nr:GNAT family N-acetyltransferase [Candidatus Sabulitectum sp.]
MQGDFELKGKKIILRPTTIEDMVDYERWNDPSLKAFQYDGPWYKNDDNLKKLIEIRKRKVKSGLTPPYRFLEIYTTQGKHIGWVNAGHNVNDPHATEIGISIKEDQYWGKGLGTETIVLWLDYLFREMNLTRIGFTTWQGNPMMIGLGKKLGFAEEARIRKSCFVRGQFYDRICMGILREEWETKRNDFLFLENH